MSLHIRNWRDSNLRSRAASVPDRATQPPRPSLHKLSKHSLVKFLICIFFSSVIAKLLRNQCTPYEHLLPRLPNREKAKNTHMWVPQLTNKWDNSRQKKSSWLKMREGSGFQSFCPNDISPKQRFANLLLLCSSVNRASLKGSWVGATLLTWVRIPSAA